MTRRGVQNYHNIQWYDDGVMIVYRVRGGIVARRERQLDEAQARRLHDLVAGGTFRRTTFHNGWNATIRGRA